MKDESASAQAKHEAQTLDPGALMNMTVDLFILALLIGIVGELLLCPLLQPTVFGFAGDLFIGSAGAFAGLWLVPHLRLPVETGSFVFIASATGGTIILLLFSRAFGNAGRFSAGRRRDSPPPRSREA